MSVMSKSISGATLAGAFAMAIGSLSVPSVARADDAMMMAAKAKTEASMKTGKFEMCYGVALKGQNDCAAGAHSCAGTATLDYDPASFKLVAVGTCTAMKTPKGAGTLTPM